MENEKDIKTYYLDRRVILVWLLPDIAVLLVLWILLSLLLIFSPTFFGLLEKGVEPAGGSAMVFAGILLLGIVPLGIYNLLKYKNYTYSLGPKSMIIRKGIIFTQNTSIAYTSIRNVTAKQTLMDRLLKLFDMHIDTAGKDAEHSSVTLPGLSSGKMNTLTECITEASHMHPERGASDYDRKLAEHNEGTGKVMNALLDEIKGLREDIQGIKGGQKGSGESAEIDGEAMVSEDERMGPDVMIEDRVCAFNPEERATEGIQKTEKGAKEKSKKRKGTTKKKKSGKKKK